MARHEKNVVKILDKNKFKEYLTKKGKNKE